MTTADVSVNRESTNTSQDNTTTSSSKDDIVEPELEREKQQWAAIRSPGTTSLVAPRSRAGTKPASSRSLSRTRSQNGYGCDDQDEDDEDAQVNVGQGHSEKDPFEVGWEDGENDPMNPRSRSTIRKWLIVLICSASALCVTCTSSIYTSTYAQLEVDLNCSRIVATLGLSLFVLGLGCGPMFLGPLSEFYGRRPIFIVSFSFFLIWLIPSAVAQNIQTMLVARFFDGLSGSAFLSVSGGTVGDMFIREELQAPMMIFTAAPFIGPSIGPLIGGFINYNVSWRWTFYVLLMWTGCMLALIVFLVPETYHPVVLKKKAQRLRKETGEQRWRAPMEKTNKSITRTILLSLKRPFQLLFFEAMVLNLCLYSSILLGILYLFFGAFSLVFSQNHGFSVWQVGLSFLGIFCGMVAGVSSDTLFHRYYKHLVAQREAQGGEPGGSEPEFRLPPAIVGAPLVTIGLFWFGWTTYSSVHWVVPIIGSAIFGMGYRVTGCARMATYRKLSPSGIRPSGVTESTDISLSLIDQTSGVNKIQVPRQWLLNLFSYIVAFGPVDAGIQIGGIMSLTAGNNRTVLCFSGIFTFLVDAYPMYAASALAANSFARSSFAAAFPLFGVQMYEKLGFQWATSLLAFLTVAMLPFPWIFFRYGKHIRRKSRFATSK